MKHMLQMGALATVVLFCSTAYASPWTLPKGDVSLNVDFDFQGASSEFLDDRVLQTFPLEARFNSSTLRLGARYGFSDRFEGGVQGSFKSVSYTARPAIIELPEGLDTVDLQGARDAILDFTRRDSGASDAWFSARYNFVRNAIRITTETRLKLPTGYTKPESTFNEDGVVADDVTLGDGQADLEQSILFGAFVAPTRSFVRFNVGGRFRFGSPGHQVFGGVKIGQYLGSRLVLFVGSTADFTVIDGEPIGESIVARRDDVTPEIITADLIELRELRLDKDKVDISGGILFVVQKGVEVQASYSRILFGRNLPVIQTFSVGTSFRIPTFGAEDP